MVAQNKLGRTKRQHDKLIAIKWEVRAPKPKGCCLLPIVSRKICCRGMGGVKSINEQQSYARDWEWVEARERERGKGKGEKKGRGLFFCDEEISSSVGFQLSTPYLMSHQLNVSFSSKKKGKMWLYLQYGKKRKSVYNKENSYKIH